MIRIIKGTVTEIGMSSVVVDTISGIGYEVSMSPESELWETMEKGNEVILYTSQFFRENEQGLYGFQSPEERNFYELLLTVSGVGPKLGATMVGSIDRRELASMILEEDAEGIARIPGIGKKTAERVIIELRDKVIGEERGLTTKRDARQNEEIEMLNEALEKLGFNPKERDHMLDGVEEHMHNGESVEDVLKKLLADAHS